LHFSAAPNDKAFRDFLKDYDIEIEDLLCDNNEDALEEILRNHIVDKELMVDGLGDMRSVENLAGNDLRLRTRSGDIYVNDAKIVRADLDASNGVIHKIDKILVPDDLELNRCEGDREGLDNLYKVSTSRCSKQCLY